MSCNIYAILSAAVHSAQLYNGWTYNITDINEVVYSIQKGYNIDITKDDNEGYITPEILILIGTEVQLWEISKNKKEALNNDK